MTAKIYQFRKKVEPAGQAVAQAVAQDRLQNALKMASTPTPPPVGETTSPTWMLQFVDTLHANLEALGLDAEAAGPGFKEITHLIVTETATRLSIKGVHRLPKGWMDFLDIQCMENGNPEANPANVRQEVVEERFKQFILSWHATQKSEDAMFQLSAAAFALRYFYEKGYWLMAWKCPPQYTPGAYPSFYFIHPKQPNVKYQIGIDLGGLDLNDYTPAA